MPRQWYEVVDSTEALEIVLYGDIGESWWDDDAVGAKTLLDLITDAKGKPIDLRINSGGGSVFDAYAMMTLLARHDAKVTAYVDGLAASAASFLLAAADEIVMSSVSWIMIHEPSGGCWGTAEELRKSADWMERVGGQIAEIYAKRSPVHDGEYFSEAMAATTWYTASEALEAGLVDRVDEAVALAACATSDKKTLTSAPVDVRSLLVDKTCPAPAEIVECDTEVKVITSDTKPVQEDGLRDTQERIVVLDSKIYRMKGAEHA